MFVTMSFSCFVYISVVRITQNALDTQRLRVERRFKEFGMMPGGGFLRFDEDLFFEIRRKTLAVLLLINMGVLVSSSVLGYLLSGKTLQPIEDMLKKQKRFISDAAHELKTPLTAIKTDLEVTLRDKELSKDTAVQSIKSTIQEVDKLNTFITKLLSKSRYQDGNLKMEPVNMVPLLQKIADSFQSLAKIHNQEIILDLKEAWIMGNVFSLEELFRNLIDNAIKYNKEGASVEITSGEVDNIVVVKIKDQGVGIDGDALNNIFEPFYRADSSRAKDINNGFGLGLSIAKDAADKHKAKIHVESKKDLGTTFTVEFKKLVAY